MATVTLDLLDSMLTPTPGQPAEALYRSIPLSTRVRDLTLILGQLYSNAAAAANRATTRVADLVDDRMVICMVIFI